MILVTLSGGAVFGVVATALVFLDTGRRGLSPRSRYLWTGGVGVVSVGGPPVLAVLDGLPFGLYRELARSPVVVGSPRELVGLFLSLGLATSALAVLGYGVGSRVGPLGTA